MAKKLFGDRFEDASDPEDVTKLSMGMRATPYSPDADITRVAQELIARHPESLGHLVSFNLIYLRRQSSRADNEFHPASAAGVFIRADRERAIRTDVDAGVWFQGQFWDRFNVQQREAWTFGQLLRFGMSPKGALKILRPDVVEWAQVVRIYGPWADQLQLFSEALHAQANPPPKPAAIARREAEAAASTPPVVN